MTQRCVTARGSCGLPGRGGAGRGDTRAVHGSCAMQAPATCDELASVPLEQRCSFVRQTCPSGVVPGMPAPCPVRRDQAAACCWGDTAVPQGAGWRQPLGGARNMHSIIARPRPPARPPAESLLPYSEWYHCYVAHQNVLLRFLYVVSDDAACPAERPGPTARLLLPPALPAPEGAAGAGSQADASSMVFAQVCLHAGGMVRRPPLPQTGGEPASLLCAGIRGGPAPPLLLLAGGHS